MHDNRDRWTWTHLVIPLTLWGIFLVLTLVFAWGAVDDTPDRVRNITFTALATPLGPMTGAVSRQFQQCCLEFSLALLPYCLGSLLVGTLAQVVLPLTTPLFRVLRLGLWSTAWVIWFGGGIASLGHALS